MHVFYAANLPTSGIVSLDKEESKHLVRVLRLNRGDKIITTNGNGLLCEATIITASPDKAEIQLGKEMDFKKRGFRVHIAVAPTKNIDRIEWFVEKAVELGIEEISFIRTERSERKNINLDRLQKIAISGIKQSLKPYLPTINDIRSYNQFLETLDETGLNFVAHLEEGNKVHLKDAFTPGRPYTVLIGPEGDFTLSEIESAKSKKVKPVSLGDYRLRTETAALVACHILNLGNE